MTNNLTQTSPATPLSTLAAFALGLRSGLRRNGSAGGFSWPRDGPAARNRAFQRGRYLAERLGRHAAGAMEPCEQMAFWEVPGAVRVSIGWIGEGYAGDYNEADPHDKRLLRFDARDLAADHLGLPDSPERRDDAASYCTLVPASTPLPVLVRIARAIAEDLAERPHWKRACETWSHVNPAAYA